MLSVCLSQVYDTPPTVVKGPSSAQDIYDTPSSKDKNAHHMVKGHVLSLFVSIYHLALLQKALNEDGNLEDFILSNSLQIRNKVNRKVV